MESTLSLNGQRVLLELHTLHACNRVLPVGISKPGHQQVFYVTICSFSRSLTLRRTGFAMNHNRGRPKVFNFRDDVGCKLNTVVALKYSGYRAVGVGWKRAVGVGWRRAVGVGQWV